MVDASFDVSLLLDITLCEVFFLRGLLEMQAGTLFGSQIGAPVPDFCAPK
jgi:hypothetical protein